MVIISDYNKGLLKEKNTAKFMAFEKQKAELSPAQKAERSISKQFRRKLWSPFVSAIKEYQLIQPNDKIAVCISGGKDSMLLAKMMQMLKRYSDFPFELIYLVMDPGYNAANRKRIEENAARLEIPLTIFETDIFAPRASLQQSQRTRLQ